MLDTKGPEIRTGKLESGDEKVLITEGQTFTFLYDDVIGNETKASISYKNLYQDVVPGAKILVDEPLQFKNSLKKYLDDGLLYPTARSLALFDYISKYDLLNDLSKQKLLHFRFPCQLLL